MLQCGIEKNLMNQTSAMRVLLVVDSFEREYLAMRLVGIALRRRGVSVHMCSRPILSMAFNRFKPHVVLLPKTHKIPYLKEMHEGSVIVLAQAESFVGSEDSFKYLSGNLRRDMVDLVCCWGTFDRDFYVRSGMFSDARAIVTGHPIVEAWHLVSPQFSSRQRRVVGVTSSLRAFTHKAYGSRLNPIESVIGIEEVGDSGYFLPPYHAEDWIAFEAAWIRVLYQMIKANQDVDFNIRPHPLENAEHYRAFERFPNVSVSPGGHIADWLSSIDVLCSSFSGSMLDAYFRRIPVVSMRGLIPARILQGIHPSIPSIPHEQHFPAPTTFESMKEAVLDDWRPIEAIDDIGRRVFNFPGEARPSERIAEVLIELALPLVASKSEVRRLPERWSESFFGPFGWAPTLRLATLHLRDALLGTSMVATAYGRHRILQNRRYSDLISRLSGAAR